MKKLLLSIFLIVCTITAINSQSNEAYIKYKIEMSSESPEAQMGLAMMNDSELEITFRDKDSRMNMKLGDFMSVETVTKNNEDVLLLMSGMMFSNVALKTTKTQLEISNNGKLPDFSVNFVKGTKEILGYTCKKALVSSEGFDSLVFWYTEIMDMPDVEMLNANGKVPGIVLAFETTEGGVNMNFTAVEIKTDIDDTTTFSLEIPEGYDEKTYEEFIKMSGGM